MDTGEALERPFEALPNDALRLLRTFAIQEVRFLIVGGYAVRVHGYLRPVADLDLLVDTPRTKPGATTPILKSFLGF